MYIDNVMILESQMDKQMETMLILQIVTNITVPDSLYLNCIGCLKWTSK